MDEGMNMRLIFYVRTNKQILYQVPEKREDTHKKSLSKIKMKG